VQSARASVPAALASATIKAGMRVAAGKATAAGVVPASVSLMMRGEVGMMTFAALKVGVGAVLSASVMGLIASGGLPVQFVPEAAAPPQARGDDPDAKALSVARLKQIFLALYEYNRVNDQRYPPSAIRKDGKPLLSWRVTILPFLGQKALYAKFHLDEPWDSPHNKALLKEMPDVYAPVVRKAGPEYSTYYQGFVGPGAVFDGDEGTKVGRITDGAHRTIAIAEAANSVPWTKPEDLSFSDDEAKPLPRVGGLFEGGFHVIVADYSVVFLSKAKVDPKTLRALITIDGGDGIDPNQLKP
jgi:hypothetical protein